jgi:hypothetical protein
MFIYPCRWAAGVRLKARGTVVLLGSVLMRQCSFRPILIRGHFMQAFREWLGVAVREDPYGNTQILAGSTLCTQ